jgi:hypothetical protein
MVKWLTFATISKVLGIMLVFPIVQGVLGMSLELFTSWCPFLGNSRHYMDSCSNADNLSTLYGFDKVTNPYEEMRFLPCPKICEKVWHRRSYSGLRWDRTFQIVSTSLSTGRKLRTL